MQTTTNSAKDCPLLVLLYMLVSSLCVSLLRQAPHLYSLIASSRPCVVVYVSNKNGVDLTRELCPMVEDGRWGKESQRQVQTPNRCLVGVGYAMCLLWNSLESHRCSQPTPFAQAGGRSNWREISPHAGNPVTMAERSPPQSSTKFKILGPYSSPTSYYHKQRFLKTKLQSGALIER
jgi:hypothetical protein